MSIKTSRPFRILALPLVRIPHGPLRVTPRIAAGSSSPSGAGSSTSTAAADLGAKAPAKDANTKASTPGAVEPTASEAPLMLYHVQQPDPSTEGSGKQPFYQKALDKAAAEWNKLGKKPHNSWMYWFHAKGEKLMDRIDYEEWALKAVHENRGVKIADPKKGEKQDMIEVGATLAAQVGLTPDSPLEAHTAKTRRAAPAAQVASVALTQDPAA